METRGPTRRGISSRKGIDYFAAIIAALLISLAAIVSVPTASYARVTSDDPSGEGRVGLYLQRDSINRMWLGTQVPSPSSDGWPTFCVQMALAIETSTQVSVTNVPEATPFVEGLELTTPQAAYLLEKYSNTTDSTTAAAIALLVHVNFQQDVYGSNNFAAVNVPAEDAAQWVIGMVRSTAPYVETRAQELREEAINSGVIGYDSGVITGDGERSGSVNMIGATDEAGNYLLGVDVTLTLNGPAIFDETGTDTWSGTTQETPLSLPWSATGNGDVSVSAVYLASPTTIALLNPHNHSQKRITYGGQKLVEHYADTVWFKVLYSFQPVGVSSVVEVTDTGEFTDYFTAYADPEFGPGTWLTDDAGNNIPVTYRVSAYVAGDSPPTLSQQVPDTAELVGQQQVTATGPSELSATFVAPAPGFYTVVWEVAEEDQA
ncbi:MAG: hypothetical protein GX483_01960, partial [Actinomycetaceae bacterium]|nr:hypothetical protein [Actinomycetaceae bacterium]